MYLYGDLLLKTDTLHAFLYVSIPDFPAKLPDFPAKNHRGFPQTLKCSQEYYKSFERRTENYPILKTFLFFIMERRFGGVGAPEGKKKNVPARFLPDFPAK